MVVLTIDRKYLDLSNRGTVFVTFKEIQPTVIVNAVDHTAVDKAEEEIDLLYTINRGGP